MSTPTIALYTRQDYDREMDATLLAADAGGVVLDRTVFYPRGGNQDCDTGVLARRDAPDAAPLAVVEVLKDDGGIIHHHLAEPSAWPPGTPVHGTLDWPRRFLLMRLHTAQHLISRWFLDHGDNATERVDITAAGCLIEFARPITLEDALACQADLNRLIRTGRAVRQGIFGIARRFRLIPTARGFDSCRGRMRPAAYAAPPKEAGGFRPAIEGSKEAKTKGQSI